MEKMVNVNAETAGGDAVAGVETGNAAVETVSAATVNAGDAAVNGGSGNGNENGLPAPLITPTGDNAGGNAGVETIEQRLGGLFGGDETKTKENANKDARLFSTFRDLEAGEVSRFYALQRLPERVSAAHVSGDIHFHDLDYTVPGGMFNCMLVDLPFILSREDFPIGNTRVNRVRSVETATDLIPQIAAQVSVGQYGGQTYSKLDEVLEPYVMYTYRRELARALEHATKVAAEMGVAGVEPLDKSVALMVATGERDRMAVGVNQKLWDMSVAEAKKRTESIVYDSMEGVEYALNTVQGNGQTPFVTISFGLATSWAGRVVQKAILKVRINGYGAQSKTPVFPKLVYMLKEGVNMRAGDPNYDVKRLALYCASKRIYPDFQSVDNTVRDLGFNPTSMGCFAGDHTVRARMGGDGGYATWTGEKLWEWAANQYGAKKQPNGVDKYVDVPSGDLDVADSHTGAEQGARVLRLVKNYSNVWVRVKVVPEPESNMSERKIVLTLTDDHPLPVQGKGRLYAGSLVPGDRLTSASGETLRVTSVTGCAHDGPSYDLTTDTDYFDLNGVVSHNCRSFLSYYENPETGEPVEYGRFNVGVVTLNLPRIAMQTESTSDFMRLLDARAGIVREALDWRFDQVREATASQSPIHYVTGAAGVAMSPSDKVGDLVEGGYATASMGYIGVYEAVARFYGGDWYGNREAVEFSVNIVRRLDELARSWKAESGRGYGVYGTPSESLCDRFARLDTRLFGDVENITSKGYYQNSFHVDVRKNMSPFEKWRVEAQYLPYTTGGAIDYVETETLLKNPDALESIVDAAVAAGVRYFGVNQPVSQCFECDYSGEFAADVRGFYCPDCGERDEEKISVVRRVCGYLGSFADRPVVEGKRKEIVARVKHLRVGDAPDAAGVADVVSPSV
jgi:anaerobic ribonucleoside-triphosphate reductase